MIDWRKYSNTPIKISKVICEHCKQDFYELYDSELGDCPHCEGELNWEESETTTYKHVQLYIDYKTGEVKIWEG